MSLKNSQPSLPHDIFHSHIIPDILSDHLHQLLVGYEAPKWHPFCTLPLVSHAFRDTCQALSLNIFGLHDGEGGDVIDGILTRAQTTWDQAKLPPAHPRPPEQSTYAQLMSSKSLIQVYLCAAFAQWFFHLDVLRSIELQVEFGDEGMDTDEDDESHDMPRTRRFKMRDDTMHRVYLPLTCAMKLCDDIRPERLAYVVAKYLADETPLLATAPVMLKYTQDLEAYVAREHRVDQETWVNWTSQTLALIDGTPRLLRQMQGIGKLVKSFKRPTVIPPGLLDAIKFFKVLEDVIAADWGPHSEDIRDYAIGLLDVDEWNRDTG